MTPRDRVLLFEREDGTCERCGRAGSEAHHRVYRSRMPGKKNRKRLHDLVNIELLCRACHHQEHHGGRVFT